MKVGTKTLLFGVHQFIWHPLTVLLAWIKLYGWPTWEELICIFIHDWGYWGCSNIDGEEGERHPEGAARIALYLLGNKAEHSCLYHSFLINFLNRWGLEARERIKPISVSYVKNRNDGAYLKFVYKRGNERCWLHVKGVNCFY